MNPERSMNTRLPVSRAFTMVELMFSVLVVGILLGLLIVGARSATRYVKETGDRQAVRNVAMAVTEFRKQFGFIPPLVKELPGTTDDLVPLRTGIGGGGADVNMGANPRVIRVYDRGNATDLDALEAQGVNIDPNNPFEDDRYSVRSLAIYLVGGLNVGFDPTRNNPGAANFVSIDGVTGPGFFAPRQNGTFEVPPEALMAGGNTSKRGSRHEPLLNLGGSTLRLFTDPGNPAKVSIQDRNGVAIRYYCWEPLRPASTPPDLLGDLRVPAMVGRVGAGFPAKTPDSRNLSENKQLVGAKWAVVGAGPNRFFGDEDIGLLRRGMGMPAGATDAELRAEAEEDNIVEVGQ